MRQCRSTIFLSDLYLPQGSELYIYNEAGTMFSGPVTKAHVYDGHYATDIISGEEVYIVSVFSVNAGHKDRIFN